MCDALTLSKLACTETETRFTIVEECLSTLSDAARLGGAGAYLACGQVSSELEPLSPVLEDIESGGKMSVPPSSALEDLPASESRNESERGSLLLRWRIRGRITLSRGVQSRGVNS